MTLFISRLLAKSRFLVGLAVLGSFAGMVTLLFQGIGEVYHLVLLVLGMQETADVGEKLTFSFIEVLDTFLLATVCYIMALGLYELFVDDRLELPSWLTIRNLDDLKNKLTSVIIVLMSVLFLGQVVSWDGERDLLRIGAPIALVIASLTWFLRQNSKNSH
jgi:uncharacterized membrane protein YqhA